MESAHKVKPMSRIDRPFKNLDEAGQTKQNGRKKRRLPAVNEHFEAVFNAVLPMQAVFLRPVGGGDLN